jgi:hypothetical protein
MIKLINWVNHKWNQVNFWFHDMATKLDIGWIVSLSIWSYDRMYWRLPEKWQLIGNIPYSEYLLQYELDMAKHQARYYANYAYDLQWIIIESIPEKEDCIHITETEFVKAAATQSEV